MRMRAIRICRPHLRHSLATAMLAVALCCAVPALAEDETPAPEPAAEAAPAPAPSQPAAIVNGKTITNAEVDAHAATAQIPREDALEDLIDLQLIKAAATARQVKLPNAPWSPEARAGVELAVARALGIEAALPRTLLIVDHAWIKDVDDAKERAAGRGQMEKLRTLVAGGASIPEALTRMQLDGVQVDGSIWHIGDHEEYMSDVLPTELDKLSAGSLSPIIPGDGGLHLFKIYERKAYQPAADVLNSLLRDKLRENATIERPELN